MKKRVFLLWICIFMALLSTGCWNNRPLKKIFINAAIGIDSAPNNQIQFSVQLVKAAALQTEQTAQEKAFVFATNKADTLHQAGRSIATTFLDKMIYIDHVQLIVIGEEMAKKGIGDALDFWERDHEANIDAILIVTKDVDAATVLQAESQMEPIPSQQIKNSFVYTTLTAESYESTLFDCLAAMNTEGAGIVVGMIQFKEGSDKKSLNDIDLRGAAVLKDNKLAGYIGPDDVKALMIVRNEAKGALFDVHNPFLKNEFFNYEMLSASTKMEVTFSEGQPSFTIKTKIEGGISELHGEAPAFTKQNLEIMAAAVKEELEAMITQTIRTTQDEFDSDIFGFSTMLSGHYPDYWQQNKDNWDEIYKTLPVSVEAEVLIKEFGRIYGSNESKKDEKFGK